MTLKEGTELLTPPADQLVMLPRGIHDLGVANLFPDEDKHIRHFLASVDPDPQRPGLGFAIQLGLRAAGKDPAQSEWEIEGARLTREPRTLAIGYTGPPGTIPVVSMNTLLKPDVLRDPAVQSLKDKAVVMAASNAGTPDRHFTPYARGASAELMTGGEIHANIVETILSGRYPRALPPALEIVYLAVLLAVATWGFMRLSVPRGVALALGVCVAVALPSYLLCP